MTKRGRTRSENLQAFDNESEHPFNDILKQDIINSNHNHHLNNIHTPNENNGNGGLYTIPELTTQISDFTSNRKAST